MNYSTVEGIIRQTLDLPLNMKKDLSKKELSASNSYWFENFSQKSNQVDALCTYAAERLGKIDFEMWRYERGDTTSSGLVASKRRISMLGEKVILDRILTHFHGFLDIDYLIANDTGRENIERNKTRKDRYKR